MITLSNNHIIFYSNYGNDSVRNHNRLASGKDEPNSSSGIEPPDRQEWREPLA